MTNLTQGHQAFEAGWKARTEGKPITACPITKKHMIEDQVPGSAGVWIDWRHGWKSADRELETQPQLPLWD